MINFAQRDLENKFIMIILASEMKSKISEEKYKKVTEVLTGLTLSQQ